MPDNQNDISGKVGLDTTNFKAGTTELNRQINIIKTGFEASAAGMEDWSKSQEGLKLRIDSLSKIIELQKQKVENLTREYNRVAAEQGEDSKAAQNLQIQINKQTKALNENETELKQNQKALDNFGKENDQAKNKVGGLGGKIKDFASSSVGQFTTLAGAAAALWQGLQKVWETVTAAAAFADEMNTLSAKTGVAVDTLQKWSYASRIIDSDFEVMTGSLKKLTKSVGEAADGNKEITEAFKKLKVEYEQNGVFKDSEELFYELIDALGKVGNETERDIIAQKLFSKSAAELNPLIKAGGKQLKELGEEAEKAGIILDRGQIAVLQRLDDQLQKTGATTEWNIGGNTYNSPAALSMRDMRREDILREQRIRLLGK